MSYFTHLMEGFDLVGSSSDLLKRGFSRAEGSILPSSGKFGDHAFSLTGGTANVLGFGVSGIRTVSLSLWWGHSSVLEDNQYIMSIEALSNVQGIPNGTEDILTLRAHSDGSIEFTGRGIDSTLPLRSVAGVLGGNTWQHIELLVDFMASTVLYVNEIPVYSVVTGITSDPAIPALDDFSVAFYGGVSSATLYDDVVARASAFTPPEPLKKHHIHTLLPNSNSTPSDWTGDYTDVNDPFGAPDFDTTYAYSATDGDATLFGVQDMPEVPTAVHCVQVTTEGGKTGVSPKSLSVQFVGSGTNRTTEGEFALSTSYTTKLARFGGTSNGFFGAGDLCSPKIGITLSE